MNVPLVAGWHNMMQWAIPKQKKTGGGWGHGISSQGYIEEIATKNNLEFPGVIKKKSCGISWDLGFRP